MKKNKRIRNITVDIGILDGINLFDSFRVFLSAEPDGDWIPVIIIISKGSVHPLSQASDTYTDVRDFVYDIGLDIKNCKIFIELMEYLGSRSSHIFRWNVKEESGVIHSKLEEVDTSKLTAQEFKVFSNYYKDRWSIFTESLLSNDEKVEIIAKALADSVYDESSAERIQLALRFKLLETIQSGTGFKWN